MIQLSWYGTATILVEIDGEKLLFDPFFRMNKKLEKATLDDFANVDFIFNTHPHFDHLCDAPKILEVSPATIFGTPTMYMRLETKGVDVDKRVQIVCPHEKIKTKNAQVTVHRTKHVKNDIPLILKTACRILFKFKEKSAIEVLKKHKDFLMNGDIVAFEIQAEGKKILIFGSAGYDEKSNLPKDVDVLVWAFQGRSNMTSYSLPIIEKINPKKIILDHFDNAFPPITSEVNTDKFVSVMKKKHPEIEVIVPKYKQKIEI